MAADSRFSDDTTGKFTNVVIDGAPVRVHFNDVGDGSKTVVMLHGSGAGASGWANFVRNIDPFVDAGYRVILVDCPGWGKSDSIVCTGSRSDLNAAALLGVLDHLGLAQVDIVGNSMGGHSATAFALSHPSRVRKLVLMGGGTGGGSPFVPMPTEGIKLLQGLYRDPTIENLKRMMGVFVYDPGALTEDQLALRLRNLLSRPDHLENFVKSSAANPRQFPDQGPRLGEIVSPVLIIWGRDDRFVPMDIGLRLLAGLPNAQMHIFSRCGHWAQWEQADTFNRLVVDFLNE